MSLARREAIYLALTELQHPIRLQILICVAEREHSAKTIAEAIELTTPAVAYHTRYLADVGLIRLSKRVPVRGALQTFYMPTDKGTELLVKLGLEGDGAGA